MFLIDTDILIYALKGKDPVESRIEKEISSPCAISIITYGELLYGAMKSTKRSVTLSRVRRLKDIFPIVPLTPSIMETFADLKSRLEMEGKRLDDFDLLIASTALALNYRLVTNNERHFRRIPELEIENWSKE